MRFTAPVLLAALVATASLSAQGWPQWRGPAGDATVAAADAPSAWPNTYGRAWRVDVGEGYASPVLGALVVADRSAERFEAVRKYELAGSSETWALPVFTGGDLIVKDATGLTRLAGK